MLNDDLHNESGVAEILGENELAARVVEVAFQIHRQIGPGLLESAYQQLMIHLLRQQGVEVQTEVEVPITWAGVRLDTGFRADMIVGQKIIVELKSLDQLAPVHSKQLLTYLRLSGKKLGLLINFGECYLKNGIHRVANGMPP
jgi:GxxExxY protein